MTAALILEKLLAFFATKAGRWVVVIAVALAAAFAAAVHERNIGWNERDVQAKEEKEAQRIADAKAVTALDAKYRNEEKAHQADLANVGENYAADLARLEARHAGDLAHARSGAIRLSVAARCGNANGSAAPEAGRAPARSDDPPRTELPAEVTANLLGLANDADQIARQLSACQAVIKSDRSIPKGKP